MKRQHLGFSLHFVSILGFVINSVILVLDEKS